MLKEGLKQCENQSFCLLSKSFRACCELMLKERDMRFSIQIKILLDVNTCFESLYLLLYLFVYYMS